MKYAYVISGAADNAQTWTSAGFVETADPGAFLGVLGDALTETFVKLTQGEATYGKPGRGCNGPYAITEMRIALADA